MSGVLLPPSPPAEKATARQDQARKSGTGDGAGNRCQVSAQLHVIEGDEITGTIAVEIERQETSAIDSRKLRGIQRERPHNAIFEPVIEREAERYTIYVGRKRSENAALKVCHIDCKRRIEQGTGQRRKDERTSSRGVCSEAWKKRRVQVRELRTIGCRLLGRRAVVRARSTDAGKTIVRNPDTVTVIVPDRFDYCGFANGRNPESRSEKQRYSKSSHRTRPYPMA